MPHITPFIVGILVLSASFLGAALTSPDNAAKGLNGFIEGLSGDSGTFLDNVSPIRAFAFIAGMVSTVNPCGFAMLPAYLGLYLTSNSTEPGTSSPNPALKLGRSLLIGTVVASGIVLLFGIIGVIVNQGASIVIQFFPWIGLSIGIILALAGSWSLTGGKIYTGVFGSAAIRIGNTKQMGILGYFLFGVSYGVASLSCTLPIFLAVVGFSFTGLSESLQQFVIYALGMGSVIIILTMTMSIFQQTMVRVLRKTLPYFQPFSALLMMLAGGYIVYYWLTMGELIFG